MDNKPSISFEELIKSLLVKTVKSDNKCCDKCSSCKKKEIFKKENIIEFLLDKDN